MKWKSTPFADSTLLIPSPFIDYGYEAGRGKRSTQHLTMNMVIKREG
jgi:hypothetical protein